MLRAVGRITGGVAAGFTAAGGGYAYYRWSLLTDSCPALDMKTTEPPKLLPQLGSATCAYCTTIQTQYLRRALPSAATTSGNYAALTPSALEVVLFHLGAAWLDGSPGRTISRTADAWGAERLLALRGTAPDQEAPAWIGARAREPRWVGDEQSVDLCIALPNDHCEIDGSKVTLQSDWVESKLEAEHAGRRWHPAALWAWAELHCFHFLATKILPRIMLQDTTERLLETLNAPAQDPQKPRA
jgi:hypothetical protein